MDAMKAHPTHARLSNSDAAAPVVGVIIMIAVTIAIAVGAFLIWTIMIDDPETPRVFGLRNEEVPDRLMVVSAGPEANWDRVGVLVQGQAGSPPATAIYMGSSSPYYNQAASSTGADVLAGAHRVAEESVLIVAPQFLEFCADTATTNVDIVVFDHVASANMGVWRFATIDAC